MNDATHDAIVDLFGVEHVASFAHVSRILRERKVVDAKGRDLYLPNVQRLAIPIQFLHGVDNLEFMPETSTRAYEWVRAANPSTKYRLDFVADYGHMDVFIGRNAASDVYPLILKHLDAT